MIRNTLDDRWLAATERLWSRSLTAVETAEILTQQAFGDLAEACGALGLNESEHRREMQRLAVRLHRAIDRAAQR